MQICVSGFHAWRDWLLALKESKAEVIVIAERPDPRFDGIEVAYCDYGLDTGSYDFFCKHLWDGESDVLFCHDDIIPYRKIDDLISKLQGENIDHGYVFHSEHEAKRNGYHHGRMIYMSVKMIRILLDNGGIPHDPDNHGNTSVVRTGQHYNYGTAELQKLARNIGEKLDLITNQAFIVDDVYLAKRGDLQIVRLDLVHEDYERAWEEIFYKYNPELEPIGLFGLTYNLPGVGKVGFQDFRNCIGSPALYLNRDGNYCCFSWLHGEDSAHYLKFSDLYSLAYMEWRIEQHYKMLGHDVIAFGE